MSDLSFGSSYKDELCLKLEKNPAKLKLGTKIFYMILHAHFYGVAKYWNLQVLTKISSKIAF